MKEVVNIINRDFNDGDNFTGNDVDLIVANINANETSINGLSTNKVDKISGKSLVDDTTIVDLTDTTDTSLHYHSLDRIRSNHIGTQSASTIGDFASNVLSSVLTGLSTATNTVISATDTVLSSLGKLQKQISDNLGILTTHANNISNPHSVTKSQIGLGSVDNTADINKNVLGSTKINITDDRNINQMPVALPYTKSLSAHFKYRNIISSPGTSAFAGLFNFAPWSEVSGGNAYQLSFAGKGIVPSLGIRQGVLGSSSWSDWYEIYHTGNKPTLSDIGITTPTVYTPTLLNNWVNYDTYYASAGYFKTVEGIVNIQGFIKGGIITGNTSLFILPIGFRPLKNRVMTTVYSDGAKEVFCTIIVTSDGIVKNSDPLSNNVYLSLEGISFPTF